MVQKIKLKCLFGYHRFCKGIITETGRWPTRYKVQWLCEKCGIYTGKWNLCDDYQTALDLIAYREINELDTYINPRDEEWMIKTL